MDFFFRLENDVSGFFLKRGGGGGWGGMGMGMGGGVSTGRRESKKIVRFARYSRSFGFLLACSLSSATTSV